MKKILTVILLSIAFLPFTARHAVNAAEVDSYVSRDYDFAQMKRMCIWPVEYGNIPDNVRLSLPNLIEDWMNEVLADDRRMRFSPHVKSTERMWRDVEFIKGPFDFTDPFESAEATAKFYSLLGEASEGVLKTSVSVTQERRWQEPRTEYYETTERVRRVERRRNEHGRWEEIETWVYMPVTRERVIPGHWLVDTWAECEAELYDSRDLDGRFVAAARASERNTKDEGEAMQAAREAARSALRAALTSIFHK